MLLWRFLFSLDEIPFVAVEVAEHGDGTVWFLARLFRKCDTMSCHMMVVAPEIARIQKEGNAIAGLVADVIRLIGGGGFGEQNGDAVVLLRCDDYPTLAVV